MREDRGSRVDRPLEGCEPQSPGESIQFLMRAKEEILLSISAGASVAKVLNGICNALDCEIGNVVSLVSLLGDDTDRTAIAGTVRQFGLRKFCSIEVVAKNQELLGTLEMSSCKPGFPLLGNWT